MSSTPVPQASDTRSWSTWTPRCWRDPAQPGQSVLDEGSHVPAGTSRRLACDASRVVMRHDEDGRVTEVGARTRTIPPALRRALLPRPELPISGLPRAGRARAITCATGRRAARPRCRTSRCSAAAITARSTRRAIRSSAGARRRAPVSGDRTAGCCPRCRRRRRCPTDPVEALRAQHAAQGLRLDARTALRRAGWESASTWAGRSTCCIRCARASLPSDEPSRPTRPAASPRSRSRSRRGPGSAPPRRGGPRSGAPATARGRPRSTRAWPGSR